MSKNSQRLSQIVSTFGPGAMIDLPTRSVVVGGLELWDLQGSALSEPRLVAQLEGILKKEGRLEHSQSLKLRSPPVSLSGMHEIPKGVSAPIFPAWFVCERIERALVDGRTFHRRRLIHWSKLDTSKKRQFHFEDGTKSEVTPIRFVCACDKGHLQDIDWHWVVHRGATCREPMWLEEQGTSASPADTHVVCGCGTGISLEQAFQPGRLGNCRGERPWLLDRDPNGCTEKLKLLTRTATNTYFPQVLRVVSIPIEDHALTRLVEELMGELGAATCVEDVHAAKKFNSKVKAALANNSDQEVYECIEKIREAAQSSIGQNLGLAEFDILASGKKEIGLNNKDSRLYARTLDREDWYQPELAHYVRPIAKIVAVHRLREVSCLYGFTRFEALPSISDLDLEDINLSVLGSPISRSSDWLPAVELNGEGIFLEFDPKSIASWRKRPDVVEREAKLIQAYAAANSQSPTAQAKVRSIDYVLLHSISHALMSEIALECGYPSNALKERVYAFAEEATKTRYGILIYTASPGAQGTLGGLVSTAKQLPSILKNAIERLQVCSNDPICADHEPDHRSGDRATHGAACHGCLLISETSCENRNRFVDRNLFTDTVAGLKLNFFD